MSSPVAAIPAERPIIVLLSPVWLAYPASTPNAVLPVPVVFKAAEAAPIKVLDIPVFNDEPAPYPTAVFWEFEELVKFWVASAW